MAGATSDFTEWLRATITAAGFDLDKRGGAQAFAVAAGTDTGQTSRALTGKIKKPSIEYLSAWTAALRAKASPVTMREMLVRSGWVSADELPAEDTIPPTVTEIDLDAVAEALGVPDDRRDLFVASVKSVAKTFADASRGDTVSESQTGGLSAKR
jgi:hypothetical protein